MKKTAGPTGPAERLKKAAKSEIVERALSFAEKELSTLGEEKKEQNLQHSIRVAMRLAEIGFDETTIAAALMHDLKLFTGTSGEKITAEFGPEIAALIDEHTKIVGIEKRNIKKLSMPLLSQVILATAKDIRAIFISVAARLDRLQQPWDIGPGDLQQRAGIALNVYAPVCQKLGLYEIESVLQDSCLKITQPMVYEKISQLVGMDWEQRKALAAEAAQEFGKLLEKEKIGATIHSRPKSLFAINKKMVEHGLPFGEIYDLLGIRIICESAKDCYEALGIVHSSYNLIPNKFTDYIANPKENGYKSIHTVVKWRENAPLEVQIRTWEMHYECETGIAAHWQYKHYAEDKFFDKKLSWAKQLVEWQHNAANREELMENLRLDFGQSKIFVFTPKQDVVMLPEGATPVDFAFAIHSDLGQRCHKAIVNGRIFPLNKPLENADAVEIITCKKPEAKRQWLSFVKSGKAMAKIRQQLGVTFVKERRAHRQQATLTTADRRIKIAQCCSPLPGEEIIGVRTTKRKISVHRKDCKNLAEIGGAKLLAVGWDALKSEYSIEIKVSAKERPGLLPSILNAIGKNGAGIISTNAKVNKNNVATCFFKVRIRDSKQADEIMNAIRLLPGVHSAARV